jgi:two-component system, OmpR family, response regulator
MRVLLVEDELVLCDQIRQVLQSEGRVVDVAHDGEEGGFLGETEPYDAIILDIGLPKRDGLSVLKAWRSQNIATPVLILTARGGWSERVDGLDAGADDYLVKPFHMAELSARLRALIRRQSGRANSVFERGDFVFDLRTNQAKIAGFPVVLTAQEVLVLAYLVHNVGRLVSRTELSEHVYAYDGDRDSNTIAVFITRLRKKLGADLIQTERGRGYMVPEA